MTNPEPRRHIEGHVGDHSSGTIIGDHNTQVTIYTSPQQQAEDLFDAAEVEDRYRQQVIKHYNKLALTGLPEREPGPDELTLEHIFVKLNVPMQLSSKEQRDLERIRKEVEDRWRRGGLPTPDDQALKSELLDLEHKASQSCSVAEALHQHKRLVILGGPGSGKTTLTRWLAVIFADRRQGQPETLGAHFTTERLPILLELRRFTERYIKLGEQPAVPDLVAEITSFISNHAYYPQTPPGFTAQALAAGRCLLLFDGLDEIADLGARQLLIQSIQAFLNHPQHLYGENLCLVTSRPYGYQSVSLGAGFVQSNVKPFAPEDVKLFIKRWYAAAYHDSAKAEALIDAMMQNERVLDLATNPLFCTLFALVYHKNQGVLPTRRVELYEKCCQLLLDSWEKDKNINSAGIIGGDNWELKLKLLGPLAYWLHSEAERLAAPEKDFVEQLADLLHREKQLDAITASEEAHKFITTIRDRSGLLQGRGDGTLEFMHRTFQEYLTARYIIAQPYPDYIDLVMEHLHKAWWHEVHLLVIGYLTGRSSCKKKSSLLIHTILAALPQSVGWTKPYYPSSTPHRKFWKLFGYYLLNWSRDKNLSWILQRELRLILLGILNCEEIFISKETSTLLSEYFTTLLSRPVYDPGFYSDIDLLEPLYAISSTQLYIDFNLLIRSLTALDEDIRWASAKTLGMLGCSNLQIRKALQNALNDPEDDVRIAAVYSLGNIYRNSAEVLPLLLTPPTDMLTDKSPWVRMATIDTISKTKLNNSEISTIVTKALNDPNLDVRWHAITSLIQTEGLFSAVQSLQGHPFFINVQSISKAGGLGETNQERAEELEEILSMLTHADVNQRIRTLRFLGRRDEIDPRTVDAIVHTLSDTDINVRETAVRVLGKSKQNTPAILSLLKDMLTNDPAQPVRIQVAITLVRLGIHEPRIIRMLLHTNNKSSKNRHSEIIQTLGRIKTEDKNLYAQILRKLNKYLYNADDDVRQTALTAINNLVDGRPLPGYHWVPLGQRMEQRRRMYAILHWTILLTGVTMFAFGLSYLDAETRLMQVITVLGGLIGIAAGLAQIVGKSLRNPWEKEDA